MFLILGTLAICALIFAVKDTRGLQRLASTKKLTSNTKTHEHVARAITAFIVVAHISELSKAVSDVSIVNILATAGLLTIWIAVKSGTGSEV